MRFRTYLTLLVASLTSLGMGNHGGVWHIDEWRPRPA